MRFLVSICALFSAMAAPFAVDMTTAFGGVSTEFYGIYEEQERTRAEGRRAKIGAFHVDTDLKATRASQSNIYATDAGEVSDAVTTLRPEMRLTSDWKRHAVSVRGFVQDQRYEKNTSENHTEFGGHVNGRLDILRGTYVAIGAFSEKRFEERGNPNAVSSSVKPTEYRRDGGRVRFVHAPGRVRLELSGKVEQLDFKDGFTSGSVVIDNAKRDRTELVTGLRASYRVAKDYEAYVQANHVQTNYDTVDSALGAKRSSDGYDAVVGVAAKRSKLQGHVYAGVSERRYDARALNDIRVPQVGGAVLYRPNGLTSVKMGLKREIQETTAVDAAAYLQTAGHVRVEHALLRHILVGGDVEVARNDYKGGNSTREDDVLRVGLDGRYAFNKHFSAHLGYKWESRESSLANADYNRSQLVSYLRGAF